jgi:hypothetical protein
MMKVSIIAIFMLTMMMICIIAVYRTQTAVAENKTKEFVLIMEEKGK